MSWQTPKTDWTAPDGVSAADMNRIEGNLLALYEDTARNTTIIYVSMDGDDSTGAGTSANPYRTIKKALDSVPKNLNGLNMYIHIASGVYPEAVSIKGFSGGSLRLTGTGSEIEVNSLTVDGCSVDITSLTISATSAVGFIITNSGLLVTTGDLVAESNTTGVNISNCSEMHVSGVLRCNAAANAVNCSGSSRLYAGTITGIGLMNATMGGVIAFGSSTLSRYTASGGRINTGAQSSSVGGLSDAELTE